MPVNAGNVGDTGLIPELGRYPRVGNGNPLQYSCLGNHMDRKVYRATAHGAITEHAHTHDDVSIRALSVSAADAWTREAPQRR